jgi:hypothetical protein
MPIHAPASRHLEGIVDELAQRLGLLHAVVLVMAKRNVVVCHAQRHLVGREHDTTVVQPWWLTPTHGTFLHCIVDPGGDEFAAALYAFRDVCVAIRRQVHHRHLRGDAHLRRDEQEAMRAMGKLRHPNDGMTKSCLA